MPKSLPMTFSTLDRAIAVLNAPPIPSRVVRPENLGNVVARFILPLGLCKSQDSKRHWKGWQLQKLLKQVAQEMAKWCTPWAKPLTGRPQVSCVRFSSVEPDRYADWAKEATDVLCRRTPEHPNRLGIIYDDAPKYADVHQWWESAKPGEGFVYIEVRTGK